MAKELPDVKFWITLNESEIYTRQSYFLGNWPPQQKSAWISFTVLRNLIRAHRAAYRSLKKVNPSLMIGVAKNAIYFEAAEILSAIVL